jgi:uncharacterized protein YyaL (SSP411 family)
LRGLNVLSLIQPDDKLTAEQQVMLSSVKAKLLAARSKRVRPNRDNKILASWNGLMLSGLARAGVILEDDSMLAAAKRNLSFVQGKLWDATTKTLYNRYCDGERDAAQLLSGYASYLSGVIEYYQATLDATALDFAMELAESMIAKFYDPKLGGFFTSANAAELIFRVKDDNDGAEPAGNSVAILALLKLAAITDNAELRSKADKSLQLFASNLSEQPLGVAYLLQAAHYATYEPHRVVIVGDVSKPDTQAMLRAAHQYYQPEKVVLGTAGKVEEFAKKQPSVEGKATAYVCTGTACQLPITDPKKMPVVLK